MKPQWVKEFNVILNSRSASKTGALGVLSVPVRRVKMYSSPD